MGPSGSDWLTQGFSFPEKRPTSLSTLLPSSQSFSSVTTETSLFVLRGRFLTPGVPRPFPFIHLRNGTAIGSGTKVGSLWYQLKTVYLDIIYYVSIV